MTSFFRQKPFKTEKWKAYHCLSLDEAFKLDLRAAKFYLTLKWESWNDSRKFQVTWKRKGEACQSILIMLRGKIGLSKPEVKKIGCVLSFLLLEEFNIYLSWNIS